MFKVTVSSRSQIAAAILAVALVAPGAVARAQDTSEVRMLQELAQDYRERARYPEDSWPLKQGQADPVRGKRTTTPRSVTTPDASAPALAVWAAEVSFERPAPVILFLQSSVPADSVRGEVVNQSGEVIGKAEYNDEGLEPDGKAGDGVYSGRFTLPEERVPDLAESYMVRVEVLIGGEIHRAIDGFLYSNPKARLTGRYRDSLQNGSLVISAEVEVREKGRFYLAGTIASGGDEPIGSAQTAAELEPGRHWLRLSFYGLMFHDRHAAGPYKLASLALSTTTRIPGAMNALVFGAQTTRAYGLGQMTSKPFGEPKLLEAARRIDEAVAEEAGNR